jgi:hypothetical protein
MGRRLRGVPCWTYLWPALCGRTVKPSPDLKGRPGRLAVLLVLAAAMGLGASPAAANPITDCFDRIAVGVRHAPHPHANAPHRLVHKVRHVKPRLHPEPHRAKAAVHPKVQLQRTHYILRPRACGTHEAMMTPATTAAPEAPELLLAALVGPTAAPVGVDVGDPPLLIGLPTGPAGDTFTPGGPGGVTPPGGFVFPGDPGGTPGGPGAPGGPGQPPVTPPDTPPIVTPPVVTPPDTPPGGPPGAPPTIPPIVIVDPPPPGGPTGPGGPGGPGTRPGGVPEPVTWATLIVGFFGIGAALRRGRARTAQCAGFEVRLIQGQAPSELQIQKAH